MATQDPPTGVSPDQGPSPAGPSRQDPDSPIALPRSADAQVLADERRRAVYLHVCRTQAPVTVNEIAAAFGIHRNAAKHHLDRLLDAGLLRAEFKRVNGRRGPGAGRPSKLYSSTDVEVAFSVPERHYDLLAHLLLQALTQGDDLEIVGARFGRRLAEAEQTRSAHTDPLASDPLANDPLANDPLEGVRAVLDGLGFRPTVERDDEGHIWITTENCPFGWVAVEATEGQVCGLDRSIIAGVLEGFGWPTSSVRGHASIANGQGTCVREAVPAGPSR